MIRRQVRRESGARLRALRMRRQDLADRKRRHWRCRRGMKLARSCDKVRLRRGRIGQLGLVRLPHLQIVQLLPRLRRDGRVRHGLGIHEGGRGHWGNWRRRGTHRTQVALDHGEPIDHMTERVVDRLEGILGLAVGLVLARAEVGDLALDDIGDS